MTTLTRRFPGSIAMRMSSIVRCDLWSVACDHDDTVSRFPMISIDSQDASARKQGNLSVARRLRYSVQPWVVYSLLTFLISQIFPTFRTFRIRLKTLMIEILCVLVERERAKAGRRRLQYPSPSYPVCHRTCEDELVQIGRAHV